MFKIFIGSEKFKVKIDKVLFTPVVEMYHNFTMIIEDSKVVKGLTALIGICKKIIVTPYNKVKTHLKIKTDDTQIKAKVLNIIRLPKRIFGAVFKVNISSSLVDIVNITLKKDSNINTGFEVINKTDSKIGYNIKIKAHSWLVRLRTLEEVDSMTLEELDSMTLEEIDYIKLG